MNKSLFTKPILITILILPLVIFQGAPQLMPSALESLYFGVPGTVWATCIWFAVMMIMAWIFGRSNTDYTGEE